MGNQPLSSLSMTRETHHEGLSSLFIIFATEDRKSEYPADFEAGILNLYVYCDLILNL